jgi:hypothetical protein
VGGAGRGGYIVHIPVERVLSTAFVPGRLPAQGEGGCVEGGEGEVARGGGRGCAGGGGGILGRTVELRAAPAGTNIQLSSTVMLGNCTTK